MPRRRPPPSVSQAGLVLGDGFLIGAIDADPDALQLQRRCEDLVGERDDLLVFVDDTAPILDDAGERCRVELLQLGLDTLQVFFARVFLSGLEQLPRSSSRSLA